MQDNGRRGKSRRRRGRYGKKKNCVYAKSCLIIFSLLNTASESKHIIELRCKTPAEAKVIIFMTWKKKLFEQWSSNCCTNSKWIYTGGKFSKEYFAKKNKRWRWNYLEASSHPHRPPTHTSHPPFSSLSSVSEKEKFISAFISKLDAIYCLSKARFSQAVAGSAYLPAQCGLRC